MPLTLWQQDNARYNGGKELSNRKRHLAQVKSALISLCTEIEAGTNPAGLTATEVSALRTAARLVAGIETAYAKDAAEAKRIQADYEARLKLASRVARGLLSDLISDTVALYAIALPRDLDGAVKNLREVANGHGGRGAWAWRIEEMARDAVAEIAYRIVRQDLPPAAWCAALEPEMAAMKNRHADLIAQVKACAVAQKLEAA